MDRVEIGIITMQYSGLQLESPQIEKANLQNGQLISSDGTVLAQILTHSLDFFVRRPILDISIKDPGINRLLVLAMAMTSFHNVWVHRTRP